MGVGVGVGVIRLEVDTKVELEIKYAAIFSYFFIYVMNTMEILYKSLFYDV